MGKRKILMVLMGMEIGGAETHVLELSKALRRRGLDVTVASNGGVYVKELEASGIRHVSIPLNRRSPGPMMKSLVQLFRLIRSLRPDLVHAHARIPGFLCGLLRPLLRFPYLTSTHGVFEVTPLLRALTNWGQHTIAVSDDIRAYLQREYGLEDSRITVTVNGIDTERFSAGPADGIGGELGLVPGTPVVGHVSRMDQASTLAARLLIEIAPSLAEKVPGVQLLLVGSGDAYAELKAQADKVNGQLGRACVLMPGASTEIHRLLRCCRVFVGVSRAALEAMACEKPVILSGSQGHLGLFQPGKLEDAIASNLCCRGFELPTGEVLEADVLQALSLPEAEQAALGAFGRQVVRERYSVEKMTDDHLEVYRKLWRPYSIVLSGYYGFRNLGDDAILQAIAAAARGMEDPLRMTVLSNSPEETRREFGVDAVYRFNPFSVYQAIRKCDYFVSGGGSLLQDHTSAKSLLYYVSLIRAAELHHKPVMIFANGIGPVRRPRGRRMVKNCLDRADCITLREASSYTELRSMGVSNPNIQVTADPVFRVEGVSEAEARELLEKAGVPKDAGRLIGVSLRPAAGLDGHLGDLALFCEQISSRFGAAVVFLDMQDPCDGKISRQVEARMKAPAWHFASRNAAEMMGVIRCMDAVVSMRLHTLIFSAKQRVPLLGIVYDPKVSAYLQMLDMPSAGTMEGFDPDRALKELEGLLKELPAYREHLEEVVPKFESAAAENWEIFSRMLRGGDGNVCG